MLLIPHDSVTAVFSMHHVHKIHEHDYQMKQQTQPFSPSESFHRYNACLFHYYYKIQTRERFKRTLFIRTRQNQKFFRVIPFVKYKMTLKVIVKQELND